MPPPPPGQDLSTAHGWVWVWLSWGPPKTLQRAAAELGARVVRELPAEGMWEDCTGQMTP